MSTNSSPIARIFRLCLHGEKKGLLGAPTFDISLLIDPVLCQANGRVHISQSVTPPGGNLDIDVTGTYHELVFGADVTHNIVLSGYYFRACPPPALCVVREHFSATITLDKNWNGTGNFVWGNQTDYNVPVNTVSC